MEDEKRRLSDLPENIVLFRKIINHVKRSILESNDGEPGEDNSEKCVQRLKQFGNVVISLLENRHEHTKEHKSVMDLFKRYKFDIEKLSESEKDLCNHYVINDAHVYVYDLNPHRFDWIILTVYRNVSTLWFKERLSEWLSQTWFIFICAESFCQTQMRKVHDSLQEYSKEYEKKGEGESDTEKPAVYSFYKNPGEKSLSPGHDWAQGICS